jgi:hypothetical protein
VTIGGGLEVMPIDTGLMGTTIDPMPTISLTGTITAIPTITDGPVLALGFRSSAQRLPSVTAPGIRAPFLLPFSSVGYFPHMPA